VEDDILIAMMMEQMLRGDGWSVIGPVPSGEQAIRCALAERPDVVIMDVRLKGAMDGLQAAEEIRARSSTPVIFCTAHTDARTRERVERLGGAFLVPKPAGPEALRGALMALGTLERGPAGAACWRGGQAGSSAVSMLRAEATCTEEDGSA
jgi:two-component system, response regulator PdtaR